jgi:hypothetical protein
MPGRLNLRNPVVQLILVLLGLAVAGALCGILWEWLWTPAKGVVVKHAWYPISWDRAQPAQFSGTGWYVLISLVVGLLLGALAAWRVDRWPLATLVTVVVGGLVGEVLMRVVGYRLRPGNPNVLAKTAADGTALPSTLHLASWWLVLAMPGAALAGLTIVFLLAGGRAVEKSVLSEPAELSSPE